MNITTEQSFELLRTGKEHVALMITGGAISKFSEYGEITLRVAFVKNTESQFDSSLGFYDNSHGDKNHYRGLQLTASMDSRSPTSYGIRLNFQTSTAQTFDLDELDSMRKSIRPILRKLQKIEEKEGQTLNFEKMALRLARVLKVKHFYTKQEGGCQWKRNDNMLAFGAAINDKIQGTLKEIGYSAESAA